MDHSHYMLRCLELARLGEGRVAPNPMVGCVIVHDGRIIGEGYHRRCGEAHAEVNAVNAVKDTSLLPHSTMYVSLEPCAHHGKTPPCADLIIEKQIPEVHIATMDPFAAVAGKGIGRLKEAGVIVHVGMLENEARELNRRFFLFHERKRPFIILKWAETHDGFVDGIRNSAGKEALRITCDAANVLTHRWRSQEAAIMVGTGTAMLDNPLLTVRMAPGGNPTRIVLDRNLKLPSSLRIFNNDADTLIINELKNGEEGRTRWLKVPSLDDLPSVMRALHGEGIQSVLVEGGPTLHRNLIATGLWDEARRYVGEMDAGEGCPSARLPLNPSHSERIGSDMLHHYRNRNAA